MPLVRQQEAVLEVSEDIHLLPVRDTFAPATSGRLNSDQKALKAAAHWIGSSAARRETEFDGIVIEKTVSPDIKPHPILKFYVNSLI